MIYRLMWNLKNTDKIKDFNELKKISIATVDSKLYGLFWTIKGNRYLFDLSKVYSTIPNTIKPDKIDVSPDDHKIMVDITGGASEIRSFISNPPTKEDDKDIKKDPPNTQKDLAENEEEIDGEVIEKEVLGNENIDEEEKEELLDEFEENIADKMKEKGLLDEEDEK